MDHYHSCGPHHHHRCPSLLHSHSLHVFSIPPLCHLFLASKKHFCSSRDQFPSQQLNPEMEVSKRNPILCCFFIFLKPTRGSCSAGRWVFSPPLKCEDVLRWGGGVMRGKVSDCRCQLCFTSKAFFSFYEEMMARNCFGNFIPNVPSVIHTTVSSNQIISDRAR